MFESVDRFGGSPHSGGPNGRIRPPWNRCEQAKARPVGEMHRQLQVCAMWFLIWEWFCFVQQSTFSFIFM